MMQIVKLYSLSRPDLGAYVTIVGGHQETVRDTLMDDFDDYVNSFGTPDGERGFELLCANRLGAQARSRAAHPPPRFEISKRFSHQERHRQGWRLRYR